MNIQQKRDEIKENVARCIALEENAELYNQFDSWGNESIHKQYIKSALAVIIALNSLVVIPDTEAELPDNEFWRKNTGKFEAYCSGRNDMLGAGYVKVDTLIEKEEEQR